MESLLVRRFFIAFLFLFPFAAFSQEPSGGTISSTNTFQQIWAFSSGRQYCGIQNTGTHVMYIFFGATGDATTSNSFQLYPGNMFYCGSGPVDRLAVQITGTSGDTYVAYQL